MSDSSNPPIRFHVSLLMHRFVAGNVWNVSVVIKGVSPRSGVPNPFMIVTNFSYTSLSGVIIRDAATFGLCLEMYSMYC